jgi:hypothetical protein
MGNSMKEPRQPFYPLIECRNCGNETRMKIVGEFSQVETRTFYFGDDKNTYWGDELDVESGPFWELVLCPACHNISLRRTYFQDGETLEEEIVYPTNNKPIEGLPSKVNIEYKKALKVQNIDSNAFAVLLGRVLDKVCLDKGATGKSLADRLKSLASKNIIPKQLADMALQLKDLRNVGAHADLGNLTPAEVPILHELCRAILEYVYTAPELMRKVQVRIDKLKKKKPS